MATSSMTPELSTAQQSNPASAALVVCLASLARESLEQLIGKLAASLGNESIVVATPDSNLPAEAPIRVFAYTPLASPGAWTPVAADFLNAFELSQKFQARGVLLLGAEAQTLSSAALRDLADAVLNGDSDLAVPRYTLPPLAGLVNSAILYPLSRTLFATPPRFPLAIDLGLSPRMAERMAAAAQRFTAANQPDALLWPVAEAAVAGYRTVQIDAGERSIPQPAGADLNGVLAQVAGSLFSDLDLKASFWQRARVAPPSRASVSSPPSSASPEDVNPMLEAFRIAYQNLHEVWSLVLPPQSLLGLKRLSVMPAASFAMPDSLWARIVYDFLLAYRLRTINRGHLLGALTPLYLAWVASHVLLTSAGTDSEAHIEAVAAAFEADKPYLVSRWRWPDRFNP